MKQKSDTNKKKSRLNILIIIGCVIFIGAIGKALNKGSSTTSTHPSKSMAYIIAQKFVENRLKSPSTADFPMLDYQAAEKENGVWFVRGYVDSQNGFGATIRTNWIVKMQYMGNSDADPNNWTLLDFTAS